MLDLLPTLINLGLGALGALIGAILLWKFWALPRIRSWIFDQGAKKLLDGIQEIVDHPDGEEAQKVGKLAGLAFAYVMQGVHEQLSTKEGREAWRPIWEVVRQNVMGSIFATWGHILKDLEKQGQDVGLPGNFSLPDPIVGLVGKVMPGVDPKSLVQMASWLSKFQGIPGAQPGNGGAPSKAQGSVWW